MAAIAVLLGELLLAYGVSSEPLHLNLGRLAHSNLGHNGPDFGKPPNILYKAAAKSVELQEVDLVIESAVDRTYASDDPAENSASNGIGKVNVKMGTKADLEFRFFKTGTRHPAKVDQIALTVFMTDPSDRLRVAAAPLTGFSSFCLQGESSLSALVQQDPSGLVFVPAAAVPAHLPAPFVAGREPSDAGDLSQEELKQAVTLRFRNTSAFSLGFDAVKASARAEVCHLYAARQDDKWCRDAGVQAGYKYQFFDKKSPCGGCGCCRHRVKDPTHATLLFSGSPAVSESCIAWSAGQPSHDRHTEAHGKKHREHAKPRKEEKYDCLESFVDWTRAWSSAKKTYCCKEHSMGCPETTTTTPTTSTSTTEATTRTTTARKEVDAYECRSGKDRADELWSNHRRNWCCKHKKVACEQKIAETTTTPPTTAQADLPAAPVPTQYDCMKNLVDWQTAWPKEKKLYCCRQSSIGCSPAPSPLVPGAIVVPTLAPLPEPTPLPLAPLPPLAAAPSTGGPAVAVATAAAYPEESAYAAPSSSFSEASADEEGYNCNGDLANWKNAWSYDQKDWCCREKQLGCYDCTGMPMEWDYDQQVGCCRSQGLACEQAGLNAQNPLVGRYGLLSTNLDHSSVFTARPNAMQAMFAGPGALAVGAGVAVAFLGVFGAAAAWRGHVLSPRETHANLPINVVLRTRPNTAITVSGRNEVSGNPYERLDDLESLVCRPEAAPAGSQGLADEGL